uniref:Reverse transcriptase domain-containing protein n=1 Tax=Steinernema glaseri TaxID=37863 RepID=A0A1I7Z137_9BILA
MFLADIEQKNIEHLINPQTTFVFRYADDYLIMSTDLDDIKQLVSRLIYAVNDNGLTMKREKMSMNFEFGGSPTEMKQTKLFRWCGFTISDQLNIDIDLEKMKRRDLYVPVFPRETIAMRRRKLGVRLKIIFLKKLEALKYCARTPMERRRYCDKIASVAMKTALPKLAKYVRLYGVNIGTKAYFKRLRIWMRNGFYDDVPPVIPPSRRAVKK